MTLSWRAGSDRPFNLEFITLIVSSGLLGLAVAWFALGLPWPRCLFHDLTGLPCITCGATRSTIAFLHGDFPTALQWNPLVFVGLCGLTIFNVYAFAVLVTKAPRLRVANIDARVKRIALVLLIGTVALNWIYLLSHWQRY